MDTLTTLLNLILHLDQQLIAIAAIYGPWLYALLFLIIFCETGLVITPFLPGDSLLFATGTLAANSSNLFNIHYLFLLLLTASILGNAANYTIGRWLGPRVFHLKRSHFFNPAYLQKAHDFYERHGGKAIIIARFLPILRTFAPFVAGLAKMHPSRFLAYNLLGAFLWVGSLLYASYLFGNLPLIKDHFSSVVLVIIGLSLLPAILAALRPRFRRFS